MLLQFTPAYEVAGLSAQTYAVYMGRSFAHPGLTESAAGRDTAARSEKTTSFASAPLSISDRSTRKKRGAGRFLSF